jgi:hypothetical protein
MKWYHDEIEKAWHQRYNRELDACEQTVTKLEQDHFEDREVQLLRASLLRASGQLAKSDQMLSSLNSDEGNFGGRLAIQQALNYFSIGDYARAWPLFQRAKNLLTNDIERMIAVTNLIGCRDNLGLSFDAELAEAENFSPKLMGKFPELFSQLRLLRLRLFFRRGELHKIFDNSQKIPSQEQYFRHWVGSLPYSKIALTEIDPSDLPSHFFQFRLHTLLGKVEQQSTATIKSSELIDRIYLWVWKWLVGEAAYPLSKIISQIQNLNNNSTLSTCEDFLLLRNALGWLDLFGRSNISEKFLKKYSQFSSTEFSLLNHEWNWIQYFVAKRDGVSARCPANLFPDLGFFQLENGEGGLGSFQQKFMHLKSFRYDQKNTIYPNQSLAISANGNKLQSHDPVMLAALTLKFPSISFASLAKVLWGIRGYDPLIHAGRVQRVIQKFKKFFAVKCSTKDGILYTEWLKVPLIYNSSSAVLLPFENSDWLSLAGNVVGKPSEYEADEKVKKIGKKILREEIEKNLGCSRATAARWIKKRVESGHLKKIGNGKKVHYVWSQL